MQSTHKMLTALTMGAMLHVQGPWLDRALLRQRLAMVQSSSPSYPVMASLDLARRLLHSSGAAVFTAGLAAVDILRRGLTALPRFGLLQPASLQQPLCGDAGAAGVNTPPLRGRRTRPRTPLRRSFMTPLGSWGLRAAAQARREGDRAGDERRPARGSGLQPRLEG